MTIGRIRTVLAALLILAWSAVGTSSARAASPAGGSIFGEWHGTSTCTNRQLAPACHDEVVVYFVTQGTAGAGHAHLDARKIVDGKVLPMGELEFTFVPKSGLWESEFETPRAHGLWVFAVKGETLSGNLFSLPGRETLRVVEAKRATAK